jgi:kelch-like protein 18
LQVYEAALKWVKKDVYNRQEFLPELIAKVRLPLLTPQYLSDRVASEELVKSDHKCRYVKQLEHVST